MTKRKGSSLTELEQVHVVWSCDEVAVEDARCRPHRTVRLSFVSLLAIFVFTGIFGAFRFTVAIADTSVGKGFISADRVSIPPPAGWETEQAPGFEPGIEKTLIDNPHHVDKEIAKVWGESAVPVLGRLYRKEKWKEFHSTILSYLTAISKEARSKLMTDRFGELAAKKEMTRFERSQFYRVCESVGKLGTQKSDKLLADALETLSENSVFSVIRGLAESDTGFAKERLTLFAAGTENVQARDLANHCLWGKELERQMKLGKERAAESMSVILERERAAKGGTDR